MRTSGIGQSRAQPRKCPARKAVRLGSFGSFRLFENEAVLASGNPTTYFDECPPGYSTVLSSVASLLTRIKTCSIGCLEVLLR